MEAEKVGQDLRGSASYMCQPCCFVSLALIDYKMWKRCKALRGIKPWEILMVLKGKQNTKQRTAVHKPGVGIS